MTSNPDPIDIHVGGRVKERRVLLGMTQKTLGDALGVTFQQVQKYERGHSRIGSGRLWRIAAFFDVPVSYFFDGVGTERQQGVIGVDGQESGARKMFESAKRLSSIPDDGVRQAIYTLIERVARGAEP